MTQMNNEAVWPAMRPAAGRHLLNAIGKPGSRTSVNTHAILPGLSVASSVALEALVNDGACVYLDPALAAEPLQEALWQQGAHLKELHQSDVALLTADNVPALRALEGRNVTVIMAVPSLSGGLTLRLRGAQISESRAIAPQLPMNLLNYLRERAANHVDALDLILTCGDSMVSLPARVDIQVC